MFVSPDIPYNCWRRHCLASTFLVVLGCISLSSFRILIPHPLLLCLISFLQVLEETRASRETHVLIFAAKAARRFGFCASMGVAIVGWRMGIVSASFTPLAVLSAVCFMLSAVLLLLFVDTAFCLGLGSDRPESLEPVSMYSRTPTPPSLRVHSRKHNNPIT
jgi:hypothetical protein